MRSVSLALFAAASLSVVLGLAQAAHQDAPTRTGRHLHTLPAIPAGDGTAYYIVRLKDAPAATYAGGVPGFAATSPRYRGGRMLDLAASASYAAYLQERQSSLLTSARGLFGHELTVRFRYRYALNGLSLKLTPAEAGRLAKLPGVVSVQPVRYFAPSAVGIPAAAGDTNASRAWINAPTVWQLPTHAGTDNEGEGIVFADLDTGINHANASFAETGALDGYTASDPTNLRFGVCDNANTSQHPKKPSFFSCNDKLIGAYTYTQGSDDPNSPEDSEGHGSHTASTVVGDFVSVTLHGSATPISGVAPHASLIAYDVCDPTNLCGQDGSVAAVEQAIQDQAALQAAWGSSFKGMVLNFSIGGGDDAYADTVEQAFLSAVEAGIYVSASGGNGGPSNAAANDPQNFPRYPVEHVGPWVATNAAATHDGSFSSNDLTNFSGGHAGTRPTGTMVGAGFTAGFGPHELVYTALGGFNGDNPVKTGNAPTSGEAYPASQGAAENAAQCLYPFNAHTFSSTQIVVCDRGTIALVDKAYNVKQGGAGGVVIATNIGSSQDLPVESYVIPGTLIGLNDGEMLTTWLSNTGATPPTAEISGSTLTTDPSQADALAGFSSRGPTNTKYDDLVKPDLSGPGVSVLAAVADPAYGDGCSGCANQPETYDFFDGTSMSSPHDAGSAALLMQAHSSWTPAEVKSALMLTSVTAGLTDQCGHLDSGENCVASASVPSPQVRGAGRVDVDAADRTGLVMDETGAHYEAARNGDLTTLNLASLGDRGCGGTCSWTRTVKSAFTSATVHYTVGTSGLSSGLLVTVAPASFTLAPGQSRKLTISADSTGVSMDKWVFGQVDISTADTGDGGAAIPSMHMPLAVKAIVPAPHMAVGPSELDFTVAPKGSSSKSFTISNNGQLTLSWTLTEGASCTGGGTPGIDVDKTQGTVVPHGATDVNVSFKAGSLKPGSYDGVICITSNASDHPKVVLNVQADVTGGTAAAGGGGGGGDEGLLALAVLALSLRRRFKKA